MPRGPRGEKAPRRPARVCCEQAEPWHLPCELLPGRDEGGRTGERQPRGRIAVPRFPVRFLFAAAIVAGLCHDAEARIVLFPWQVAPSQPPVPRPSEPGNKPNTEPQHDQNQSRGLGTAQNHDRSVDHQNQGNEKPATNWWFNGGLIIVGILQLVVFGQQARRLRQSIDLTRDIARKQERDMRASIGEASRAAGAMEGVAASMTQSVANTRAVLERQRVFAIMQMRAYLSVRFGGLVKQDNATPYPFEVRMILANTGHTPAHEVSYSAAVDILPVPLPDDFAFPYRDAPEVTTSAGMLGPQQIFSMQARLDRMLTADEINEISAGIGRRLHIYGTVRYRDAFGEARYTNFSQRVEWLRGDQFMGMNTRRHNDAT